jgi:uncharacterized protein YyaL (SSP411 family)
MQKVPVFLIIAILFFLTTSFNTHSKENVKWYTIAEMQAAYKLKPRPILVDVYTSWCGWCKVMDRETYGNSAVANYINENYYAVKFDAESINSVEWDGKKYDYNAGNKANDLAVFLLQGQMSYPTTVFLPALNSQPAPLPGYFKPKEFEPYLKYFIVGEYKTKSFAEFMKSFKSQW